MAYIIGNSKEKRYLIYIPQTNRWSTTSQRCKAYTTPSYEKATNILKHLPKSIRPESLSIIGNDQPVHINNTNVDSKNTCIIDDLTKINTVKSNLINRKKELADLIGQCNLEQSDILHAAEFYSFNVVDGYRIYKMLHDVRVRRRNYIEEIEQINRVLNSKLSDASIAAEKPEKQYTPRILKGLFKKEGESYHYVNYQ